MRSQLDIVGWGWELRVGAVGVRRSQVGGTTYEKWHETNSDFLETKVFSSCSTIGEKSTKGMGTNGKYGAPTSARLLLEQNYKRDSRSFHY